MPGPDSLAQLRTTAVALVLLGAGAWSRVVTRRQQQLRAISVSLVTVRCLSALAHVLPTSNAIGLGAFIGRIAYRLAPWRRAVLRDNLIRTRAFRCGLTSNSKDDDDNTAAKDRDQTKVYDEAFDNKCVVHLIL